MTVSMFGRSADEILKALDFYDNYHTKPIEPDWQAIRNAYLDNLPVIIKTKDPSWSVIAKIKELTVAPIDDGHQWTAPVKQTSMNDYIGKNCNVWLRQEGQPLIKISGTFVSINLVYPNQKS